MRALDVGDRANEAAANFLASLDAPATTVGCVPATRKDNPGMDTEFVIEVTFAWSTGGTPATPDDCREALKRSGITEGALIGECVIADVTVYGGDDD